MIEFIEKYKNSEDILKENIKVMKNYIMCFEIVGEDKIKEIYPNCYHPLEDIKQTLKLAKKYYRNLKKGIKN